MSEFFVGQKVVCVDANGPDSEGNNSPWQPGEEIFNGRIYTIAKLYDFDGLGLILLEAKRCEAALRGWGRKDLGYHARRFRPLETKSIELFRKIAQGVTDGRPIIDDPAPAKTHEFVLEHFPFLQATNGSGSK